MSEPEEMSAPDSRIDYATAITYWEGIDADVNGMLGGFPYVSKVRLRSIIHLLPPIPCEGNLK